MSKSLTDSLSPPEQLDESLIGHYAGAVTRLVAFLIDDGISLGAFYVSVAIGIWLLELFTSIDVSDADRSSLWLLVPLTGWLFLYFWYCWTTAGRTPGMALFGLRVVRGSGATLGARHAAIRVIFLPVCFLFFGLGFIGLIFGRRRRGLHDVAADTAVVYDFDARAARLRFLSSHPIQKDTGHPG